MGVGPRQVPSLLQVSWPDLSLKDPKGQPTGQVESKAWIWSEQSGPPYRDWERGGQPNTGGGTNRHIQV